MRTEGQGKDLTEEGDEENEQFNDLEIQRVHVVNHVEV